MSKEFGMRDRVSVDGNKELVGEVIGYGVLFENPSMMVLIRLDHGFYDPKNLTFVSVMVVHPDNLRKINDEV